MQQINIYVQAQIYICLKWMPNLVCKLKVSPYFTLFQVAFVRNSKSVIREITIWFSWIQNNECFFPFVNPISPPCVSFLYRYHLKRRFKTTDQIFGTEKRVCYLHNNKFSKSERMIEKRLRYDFTDRNFITYRPRKNQGIGEHSSFWIYIFFLQNTY